MTPEEFKERLGAAINRGDRSIKLYGMPFGKGKSAIVAKQLGLPKKKPHGFSKLPKKLKDAIEKATKRAPAMCRAVLPGLSFRAITDSPKATFLYKSSEGWVVYNPGFIAAITQKDADSLVMRVVREVADDIKECQKRGIRRSLKKSGYPDMTEEEAGWNWRLSPIKGHRFVYLVMSTSKWYYYDGDYQWHGERIYATRKSAEAYVRQARKDVRGSSVRSHGILFRIDKKQILD